MATGTIPTIGSSLPWNTGQANFSGLGGNPGQIYGVLNRNYNQSMAMNQGLWQDINAGYANVLGAQQAAFGGIQKGFKNLYGNVMSGIQGSDAAAQQQIKDLYAQQQGSASQGLINAGLGNSTVTSSVSRGLTADESKSQVNLADQMAQLQAGYQSQIGQAALGFRSQAAMANSQVAQNQLQFMNTMTAGYPDVSQYSQLAQMYGMNKQAQQDFLNMRGAYAGSGGGGGQGLGYAPRPAPSQYDGSPQYGGMPSSGANIGFFNPYSGSMGGGAAGQQAAQFGQGMASPFVGPVQAGYDQPQGEGQAYGGVPSPYEGVAPSPGGGYFSGFGF